MSGQISSGMIPEGETPIWLGTLPSSELPLPVEVGSSEELLPPGVGDGGVPSDSGAATTASGCCAEYAYKGFPECTEYCDLMALMAELGLGVNTMADLPDETAKHRREASDEVYENFLLSKLYEGYISLEGCLSFDLCDTSLVRGINSALVNVRQSLHGIYSGNVSKVFLARWWKFLVSLMKQLVRLRTYPKPQVYSCSLALHGSMFSDQTWVAACSLLKMAATASSAAMDCSDQYRETVDPFLAGLPNCTTEVVYQALATAVDLAYCVPQASSRRTADKLMEMGEAVPKSGAK